MFVLPFQLDMFLRTITDIGIAISDQFDGELLHWFEVITGKCDLIRFIAQPSNIFKNVINVLMRLGFRVGVIIP